MTTEQIVISSLLKHKWIFSILLILLLLTALLACDPQRVASASFSLCPMEVKLRADYDWVYGMPPGSNVVVWTAKTEKSESYQCVFVVQQLQATLP